MFNIKYENKENILFATLKGELMAQEVKKLKKDFINIKLKYKYLVFDFKDLTLIDSAGLAYIIFCLKELREKNGDIKIQNLSNQAKVIFEITRINTVIDIFNTQKETIQSIKKMENNYASNNNNKQEIIS